MSLAKQGIHFSKLHGCANDFIVAELASLQVEAELIQRLCNRNTGVGSDGIMLVDRSSLRYGEQKQILVNVEMYNPDGSAMGMCGNGIRCVVRYLAEKLQVEKAAFVFSVFGREVVCHTEDAGQAVVVQMGKAELQKSDLQIEIGQQKLVGQVVDIGNPHFVLFDKSPEICQLGSEIELYKAFPDRTNVEFARVVSRNLIELSVWERGAGWTMACGTGACATVVAAYIKGLCDQKCTVRLPGGELEVECGELDAEGRSLQVQLKGPAVKIYEGIIQNFI